MKSYDETISAVFDRIRTNEIENQRKRKMALKLITSLGCLCLVVAVCVGVWNIDFSSPSGDEKTPVDENKIEEIPKDENKPENGYTHIEQPVGTIFLSSPVKSSSNPSDEPGEHFLFNSKSEYGVDYRVSKTVVFEELVGTKKIPFEGAGNETVTGTYVYLYSRCDFKNDQRNEYGTFYCIYDVYREEDKYIEYLHGTDILTDYFNTDLIPFPLEPVPDVGEDFIKRTGKAFVSKIISEEDFSRYDDGRVVSVYIDGLFGVRYQSYIGGYAVLDTIFVLMTANGEVVMYSAPRFGQQAILEKQITKETIDLAYEKIKEKMAEKKAEFDWNNLSVENPCIVTSTTGQAFLRIYYQADNDVSDNIRGYAYININ